MDKEEAVQKICEKLGEIFHGDFPCICGDNSLGGHLNHSDIEKLEMVLEFLDSLK